MTRGDLQEVAACNGLSENEAIDAILDSIKTPLALTDVIAGRRVIRADMVPALANALEVGVMELFKEDAADPEQ